MHQYCVTRLDRSCMPAQLATSSGSALISSNRLECRQPVHSINIRETYKALRAGVPVRKQESESSAYLDEPARCTGSESRGGQARRSRCPAAKSRITA